MPTTTNNINTQYINEYINEAVVKKFISLIPYGFVKGKGKPEPGKMCIEAALCYSMGLPHNDDPPCVGSSVREYKISLNDCDWESNIIRAKTMAPLGIAQLGSNTLNQDIFKQLIFKYTNTDIIVKSFDWISKDKRNTKYEKLKKFVLKNCEDLTKLKEKFEDYYNYYHYHDYYNYYNYYYNNYHNYYSYYHNYDYNCNLQKVLKLSVDVALKVLKEMKSPGCEFLHLLEE
jgi:hypothetical protein